VEVGELVFGIIDFWLVWNMIGGLDGGWYVIDVINVLWIMLMDFECLVWDELIVYEMGVLMVMFFEICLLSEVYG